MVHQQNYHPSNMNQNRSRSGANSNSSGIPVKRNPNSKNVIQQQQNNNVKNVNQVKKSSNIALSSRKLQRRSSVTSTEDDVRSSLDLLDSVIHEFDDGLTSGAESEYTHKNANSSSNQKNANKNNNVKNKTEVKNNINDRIDDIFSGLSHYATPDVVFNSKSRKVNDPLPTPPPPQAPLLNGRPNVRPSKLVPNSIPPAPKLPQSSKDEVVVYQEPENELNKNGVHQSNNSSSNVKAQIHSLEAKGRQQQQQSSGNANGKTKSRSRSENPPKNRQGFSYLNSSNNQPDLKQPNKNLHQPAPPPPMPEKTKIHLKSLERNPQQQKVHLSVNGREFTEDPPRRISSPVMVSKRHQTSRAQKSANAAARAPSSVSGSNVSKGKHRSLNNGSRAPSLSNVSSATSHNYESVDAQSGVSSGSRAAGRLAARLNHQNQQLQESNRLKYKRSKSLGTLESDDPRQQVFMSPIFEGGGGLNESYDDFEQDDFFEEDFEESERIRRRQREVGRRSRQGSRAGQQGQHQGQRSSRYHQQQEAKYLHDLSRSNSRGKSLERSRSREMLIEPHHGFSNRFVLTDPRVLPVRQKSMIDLRQSEAESRGMNHTAPSRGVNHSRKFPQPPSGHHGQPPQLLRSATEHEIKLTSSTAASRDRRMAELGGLNSRDRRSMAVTANEFDMHARGGDGNHFPFTGGPDAMARRRALIQQLNSVPRSYMAASAKDLGSVLADEELALRNINLEAQRDFMHERRAKQAAGFLSPNHPYITGEIPVHPEFQGRLPFNYGPDNSSMPMKPEDFQRFRPELWHQQSQNPDRNPHPFLNNQPGIGGRYPNDMRQNPDAIPFTDLAVLQNELEIRRRRREMQQHKKEQLSRQNSRAKASTPNNVNSTVRSDRSSSSSQPRVIPEGSSGDNSFQSLPWEDIILQHRKKDPLRESFAIPPITMSTREEKLLKKKESMNNPNHQSKWSIGNFFNRESSKSVNNLHDQKEDFPLTAADLKKTALSKNKGTKNGKKTNGGSGKTSKESHWVLKERESELMSMPAHLSNNLTEDDFNFEQLDKKIDLTGTHRSGFGIILKDKFQKNPNMYFPEGQRGKSLGDIENADSRDMSEDRDIAADFEEKFGSSRANEKDEVYSENSRGEESSLSPHNSMEGSPRMVSQSNFQTSTPNSSSTTKKSSKPSIPKPPRTTSSAGSLASKANTTASSKKTIRNYTPKSSAADAMIQEMSSRNKFRNNNKSHSEEDNFNNGEEDEKQMSTMTSVATLRTNDDGTVSSRLSNWSVASSTASFDYRPGTNKRKQNHQQQRQEQHQVQQENRHMQQRALSALSEDDIADYGERIPPEGASAAPDSPPASRNHQRNSRSRTTTPMMKGDFLLPENEADDDEDFSNLRKLISEGRIAGLNEKPPSFIPPTPPPSNKPLSKSPSSAGTTTSSNGNKEISRRSRSKGPAPPTPLKAAIANDIGDFGRREKPGRPVEKQPSRKTKEAPKPPVVKQQQQRAQQRPIGSMEDLTSNRRNFQRPIGSMEDLTGDRERRAAINGRNLNKNKEKIKRSPSHHETSKTRYEMRREEEQQMARLIADSTEKKFNFNPFKKLIKKKNYSFDFS